MINKYIPYIPYILCIAIMCVSIYGVMINNNYVKKLLCLGTLQTGAILFFITLSFLKDGKIPILQCATCHDNLTNPLPHVLMLTAIVVGVATLAVGLSLVLQIKKNYGSIDDEILRESDD